MISVSHALAIQRKGTYFSLQFAYRINPRLADPIRCFYCRFEPVQHGIVSLATGLFLGGHVASRGDTVVDVVKILQRSFCGASTDRHIRLPGVIFALDRGYQSKEVNQQILDCGAQIIGTHKRNASFPFTYGKAGGKLQRVVMKRALSPPNGQPLSTRAARQLDPRQSQ